METAVQQHSRLVRSLATADVSTELDGQPRVLDEKVAAALGLRPTDVKALIWRHMSALTRFAEVFRTVRKTSPLGGRPGTEYWLTKRQCLYLCTKAETPNATEVTIQMVEVFDAWADGRRAPAQPDRRETKPRPAVGVATVQIGQREVCVDLADLWIGLGRGLVIDHLGRLVIFAGPLAADGGRVWLGPRAVYGPWRPTRGPGVRARELLATGSGD